jgi:pyridoxal phosphate enzyme (YggS family)
MIPDLNSRIEKLQDEIRQACVLAGRPVDSVRLVVVTKTHPVEVVQQVIDAGVRDIAENRVQEITAKAPALRGEFRLHLVGHLQTNKVAGAVDHCRMIQSVDSSRLLARIEHYSAAANRCPDILIQVNTSGEQTKSGCNPAEALELCRLAARSRYTVFRGLMTIGPLGATEQQTRQAFAMLRKLRDQCPTPDKLELSMGMSADFGWAIAEGSTLVRIGSLLLGAR